MQRQAESLKCFPRNYYSATVLKKDGKNQSKTMMGKVADIEVTAIFDCELMFTVRVVCVSSRTVPCHTVPYQVNWLVWHFTTRLDEQNNNHL